MTSFNTQQRLSMRRLQAIASSLCVFLSHTSCAFQSPLPITTSLQRSPTKLHFFFGNDDDKETKQLAFFPKLATTNTDVKFESLTNFIETWSQKFEDDRKGMGLTTPVKVLPLVQGELEDNVEEAGGVRIVFQPTKTSYKSKEEEDSAREGGGGGDKKKKNPPKEGGVELRVERLSNGEVQLEAKRCEVDEDTMIKEMSEETIVSKLKQAIDAWKKQ